jgi:hypothetical protein
MQLIYYQRVAWYVVFNISEESAASDTLVATYQTTRC